MLRNVCLFAVFFCCFSFANAQNYNYTNDGGKGKSIAFEQYIVEENGEIVKKEIFAPVFLILRTDSWMQAINSIRSGGWIVYTGNDAFKFIHDNSGFDLLTYLEKCKNNYNINY